MNSCTSDQVMAIVTGFAVIVLLSFWPRVPLVRLAAICAAGLSLGWNLSAWLSP